MTSQNDQANSESNIFWRQVPWWVPILVAIMAIGATILQTQCNSNNSQEDFTYRVSVRNSENNSPIKNAQVIIDTKDTSSVASKTTNDFGIASFDMDASLADQAAEIRVIADGYKEQTIPASLVPNNQSQDILLTPKQTTPETSTHTPTPTKQIFSYSFL